jgi:hypothetical protein
LYVGIIATVEKTLSSRKTKDQKRVLVLFSTFNTQNNAINAIVIIDIKGAASSNAMHR